MKDKIEKQLETNIIALYQNKGKEAMEQTLQLIGLFQDMTVNCDGESRADIQKTGIQVLHRLLEAYEKGDILAIADCLEEDGKRFVGIYYK